MIKMAVTAVGLNNVVKRLNLAKGRLPKQVIMIFEESGKRVERRAKRIVRVDTGRLKKSIHHRVTNKENRQIGLWIGTDVYYSIYVERRFPYLFPSMEAEKPILFMKLKRLDL